MVKYYSYTGLNQQTTWHYKIICFLKHKKCISTTRHNSLNELLFNDGYIFGGTSHAVSNCENMNVYFSVNNALLKVKYAKK